MLTEYSELLPDDSMSRQKLQTCVHIEGAGDDALLTTLLFKRLKVDVQICHYATAESYLVDAANTEQALAEQSLIIADLNLGMTSGIDLIKSLRAIASFSTTIMGICSGSRNLDDKANAQAAGAEFFVSKPLDLETLEEICRSVPSLEIERTADSRTELYKH